MGKRHAETCVSFLCTKAGGDIFRSLCGRDSSQKSRKGRCVYEKKEETAVDSGYHDPGTFVIYIDTVFTNFEKQYITTAMTQKEKVEKAAWYIGAISDYEAQESAWYDIFIKHKGDCSASRYALQYMCEHMGIKALACRDMDYHGQTLVKADGVYYMVITGYNEPKPRKYTIYEMSAEELATLVEENNIDLTYFN